MSSPKAKRLRDGDDRFLRCKADAVLERSGCRLWSSSPRETSTLSKHSRSDAARWHGPDRSSDGSPMKHTGFLSFGHWTPSPQSETRSAAEALLQSIALAVAAEALGARRGVFPGASFRPAARLAVSAACGVRGAYQADRARHSGRRHAHQEPARHGGGRRGGRRNRRSRPASIASMTIRARRGPGASPTGPRGLRWRPSCPGPRVRGYGSDRHRHRSAPVD